MFGTTIHAAVSAAFGAVLGAFLSFILGYLLPFLGPHDGLLFRSFQGVSDHALLAMIVSSLLFLVARAVTEASY